MDSSSDQVQEPHDVDIKNFTCGCVLRCLVISEPVSSKWEKEIERNVIENESEDQLVDPRLTDSVGYTTSYSATCKKFDANRKSISPCGMPSTSNFLSSRS